MAISDSPQHIMNGQGQLVGINANRPAAIRARSAYWDMWAKIPSWKPPPLKDTIGVGIITCNREEFLKKCLASLPRHKFHQIVLVNDGDSADFKDKSDMNPKRYVYSKNQLVGNYFYTGGGRSVGFAKNWAIKELMKFGRSVELANWPGDKQSVEHFFLIEDDIIIKDENVFEKYIEISKKTGIKHMMYGYHGPANKRNGKPSPRKIVDYGDGISIALNRHCVGAFTYYHRSCFEKVGLFDDHYINAFEHVDHSYMLAKEKMSTPYWWWADVANSYDYLDELACSEVSSTIRGRPSWRQNIFNAVHHFEKKHGYQPAYDRPVPDASFQEVLDNLKQIKSCTI
jgi:glycosyltransferase involved in cell wall biosynthesis